MRRNAQSIFPPSVTVPGAHLDHTDLDENRVRDPYPIVRRIFYWLS
jgi:hypothetical protein